MMAIAMECRCCGNLLTFAAERQLLCCPACGTQNLLPQEQVRMRPDFRNARELQRRGEFCDAEASYQRVLDDVPDDADALWGRLMCHYGAKLLTGEGTQRRYAIRIPRSKPLRAQGDFERACENAPEALRVQYEQDAAYIDRAMERIRQLATTKQPYDIFICHKTTPLEGKGYTEDYGRARDLRDMLVQRGYRVFFAPMDMEGVAAGEDYEAAIYHALNTARVMLVVCSDPALLMSTWVQSEWQRFLALHDEGKDVALIPLLYGGMKAGSLPRAFQVRNLQAIRMELEGKDTLLERLQSLMPTIRPAEDEKAQKRRHPVLTTLLVLLLIAALAAGGSYVWTRLNGGGGSRGVLEELFPIATPAPTTATPVPTTATPVPTTATPAPTTATPVLTTAMPVPTTATLVPTRVRSGKAVDDFEIDVYSNSTCVITKYSGNATILEVPAQIDGNTVSGIGRFAFEDCDSLTSIILPEGVMSIGDAAFYECDSLTSITLPDSVTSIGFLAFYECDALTGITLPDLVTSIGDRAFYECDALTSVTLPDGVTSIGDYTFYNCTSLTSITLPEEMTSIGDSAFMNCYSLTSIALPNSVTSIGDRAFLGCSSLMSITLPEGVTSIGENAFYGCTSLTSIMLPEGVTSIGDHAFYDCTSLTRITLPVGVTSIGDNAFYNCDALTSITLPEGLTSIGKYAFCHCDSLESITLPDSVTSIGQGAFHYCDKCFTLYVPRNSYAATYAEKNRIPREYIQ